MAGAAPSSGGGGGGNLDGNLNGELTAASRVGGGGGGRVMLFMRLSTLPVEAPDHDREGGRIPTRAANGECGDGLDDLAAVGLLVAVGLTSA